MNKMIAIEMVSTLPLYAFDMQENLWIEPFLTLVADQLGLTFV